VSGATGSQWNMAISKMKDPENQGAYVANEAQPIYPQFGKEIQSFGQLIGMPIGLEEKVCSASVKALNQILADTATLRDLYKKHHWQVSGPTFYQLHLLFDKHYEEQLKLVDLLAERVQTLGGISLAMSPHIAEATSLPCPPKGREDVPTQISRLLEAHKTILIEARKAAKAATEMGDDGTNDLLISDIVRTNELQAWFLAEHLAGSSFS
jgi:starvation-inducible DNA-binding protein